MLGKRNNVEGENAVDDTNNKKQHTEDDPIELDWSCFIIWKLRRFGDS